MPWGKTFDINQTLDAAMQVFWQQGYQRTSMQDLIKSMGINPGSIYGTFGNKRELFIGVLRHYQQEMSSWLAGYSKMDSPKQAILAVFKSILIESAENPTNCRGCLLVNTALEVAPHDEEIAQLVKNGFDSLALFYKNNVLRGQNAAEISTSIDADRAAHSLVALTIGLRVLSRVQLKYKDLEGIVAQAELMLE